MTRHKTYFRAVLITTLTLTLTTLVYHLYQRVPATFSTNGVLSTVTFYSDECGCERYESLYIIQRHL